MGLICPAAAPIEVFTNRRPTQKGWSTSEHEKAHSYLPVASTIPARPTALLLIFTGYFGLSPSVIQCWASRLRFAMKAGSLQKNPRQPCKLLTTRVVLLPLSSLRCVAYTARSVVCRQQSAGIKFSGIQRRNAFYLTVVR